MRKRFFAAAFVLLFSTIGSAEQRPEEVWKEFMAFSPERSELLAIIDYRGLQPQYMALCAQELLKQQLEGFEYRIIIRSAPEPFAELAWKEMSARGNAEDLLFLFQWAGEGDRGEKYRDLVYGELSKMDLTEEELSMATQYSPNRYFEEIWQKLLERNPSTQVLLDLTDRVKTGGLATEELF